MLKYIASLFLLILFIGITASFTPAPPPAADEGNLKVLPSNITEKELDSIMDHFKLSLGVRCGFCHAMDPDTSRGKHLDFASDAKPEKERAREMLKMTAYLNTTFFNPEHSTRPDTLRTVMCFTCHRGTTTPDEMSLLPQLDSLMKLQRKH